MKRVLRRLRGGLIGRRPSRNPSDRERRVSLEPSTPRRGNVLLAYIVEPFLRPPDEPVSRAHTHHFESLLIARTFLDLGFAVDVIDFRNRKFEPDRKYDFFVSARTNLEAVAARLNDDCVVIAHLDTSHFLTNNQAAYTRALELEARRGVACPSIRLIEHNRAIERADYGVVLGNEGTLRTYAYAGKRLFPLNVPAPFSFPPTVKDFAACRRNFLWFGSSGFVHKGLDLALEAFSRMPDLHLYVCGPIEDDPAFCDAYRTELFHTPNVHTIGWIDIGSASFRELTDELCALVYPSCAEGQAGSAVICLHAGLVPILSRESGLDVTGFGCLLETCSVEEIQQQVRRTAALPAEEVARRSGEARRHALAFHSERYYLDSYRCMVEAILAERGGATAGTRPAAVSP
jgi:glycosyltransferase involved in cell wall biosynthesis